MNIFKKIRNFFKSIPDGIGNLIKWGPTIWKDRDWDQWYLYNIMYKKLYTMEEFHNSDLPISTTAKQTAKQIRLCRILCKRLKDDYYLSNAVMFPYDKLYGDSEVFGSERIPGTSFSRLIDLQTPDQKRMFNKASKHSDYMQKQDKEYLFKTMNKYIDGWWD